MKLAAVIHVFFSGAADFPDLRADRCVRHCQTDSDRSPRQEVHRTSAGLHPLSQQAPSSSSNHRAANTSTGPSLKALEQEIGKKNTRS